MSGKIILFVLIGVLALTHADRARFDNYRVFEVLVATEQQRQLLEQLEIASDSIQFLDSPVVKRTVELVVPPHKFSDIEEIFEKNSIKYDVKVNNLQKLIDIADGPSIKSFATQDFGWKAYYDLDQIYNWLDDKLAQYPKILTNMTVGTSYEKRTIRAVKISKKTGNPTIFLESNIHAREWITSATATYLINELLNSTDPEINDLSENFDWVIVPVLNIDGFAYTKTKNRMWRKTRQPHSAICVGADPNRNFDAKHGAPGASHSPCSETYCGPKPNSEPEILAVSKFVAALPNLKLYLSLHSYGQYLMFPYGYTDKLAQNNDDMMQIGKKSIDAIRKRYKTSYRLGPIATTIYPASGGSIDWAYDQTSANLSYVFELRDRGKYGFLLPPDQIIPNSLELIDGLVAMIKEARARKYF